MLSAISEKSKKLAFYYKLIDAFKYKLQFKDKLSRYLK